MVTFGKDLCGKRYDIEATNQCGLYWRTYYYYVRFHEHFKNSNVRCAKAFLHNQYINDITNTVFQFLPTFSALKID